MCNDSICCLSHYRLLVTEAHSQVCLCADMDTIDRLLPLIHLPVKDSRDFYSLGDIVANGQKLDGSVINILAAVKSVGHFKASVAQCYTGVWEKFPFIHLRFCVECWKLLITKTFYLHIYCAEIFMTPPHLLLLRLVCFFLFFPECLSIHAWTNLRTLLQCAVKAMNITLTREINIWVLEKWHVSRLTSLWCQMKIYSQ